MEGRSLGPYVIESELGSGGMGRVYSARTERAAGGLDAGTRVALKLVHPHLLETEGFFKRFLREAEIGRSIRHANVVRTLDCDAIGGSHFLVMEYVEGQTLRDLAEELGNVPEELCRHIATEIARGLGAIHAAGVLHRDLKPENVLITLDHQIKVMDLGVARLAAESIRLSQTGAFVGSLQYAAPESFRDGGNAVDARADLHALGLVLYELACGASPYLADDVPKTVHKVLHEEPRRLGDANPQLSPFFEEVVHCLLEKDREKRFADADALLAVLDAGERGTWWSACISALRAVSQRPLRRIRIPRETAVYGREDELAKLRGLFDAAASGEGRVVLIEGEAGIGKSRLIDEFVSRLQRDGADINFLFGSYPPSGAATASGAWSTAFREQFGPAGSASYLNETPLLVPAFDALLRGDVAPTGAEPLTKDSVGTCFVHSARALAAERATIVLIEDLHFAPTDALGLFTALALAIPEHRVLLVGTMRPGIAEDWIANLTRLDHAQQASLGRLGPKDLASLLKDSFRSQNLADSLGMRIARKSDGNPFFAFEIIRGLREGQFITQRDDGTWVTTRVIDEIEIPSSVLDLVNARVADLSDDERNLLDVASCWGFEFDPTLVGQVLGLARIPVLQTFAKMEKRHRLARSAGRNYVFDHHQVQEALYGSLNEQLREEYHAALAEALEARSGAAVADAASLDGALCVDLCEQFLRGGDGQRALRYFDAAYGHLLGGYLHAEAIDLAERVLAIPRLLQPRERAKSLLLLCRRGGPLQRLARWRRMEQIAREALLLAESAADSALQREASSAVGLALLRTGRAAAAGELFRGEAELAHRSGDHASEVRATVDRGAALWTQGRFKEALELCQRGIALSRAAGDRASEGRATSNLSLTFQSMECFAEAEEQAERHIALAVASGDRLGEYPARGNLALALYGQGRNREARHQCERSLALCCEIGDRYGEALARGNLGLILLAQGHFSAARRQTERCLRLNTEIGDSQGSSRARGNLGLILLKLGELASAIDAIEAHLEASAGSGDKVGEATAAFNLGFALIELGRLERARDSFGRARELGRQVEHRVAEAWALHGLSCVLRESGDTAGALRAAGESLSIAESIGSSGLIAKSSRAYGVLSIEAGDEQAGTRALVRARDIGAEQRLAAAVVLACCDLVLHSGSPVSDAVAAYAEHGTRLESDDSREACLLLWRATGDLAHLAQAKRQLDEDLAKVPAEYHEAMLANVRVNRDIVAAWEAHGPGSAPD